MTTTDIATTTNGTVAPLVDTENDEWSDVSDGDLDPNSVHRIPLLAFNRKMDGSGGVVNPDTGELVQELDFVWLAKVTTRAYFPDAFGKGSDTPTCRSFDGLKPDPNSPNLQSDVCATCPHSQWKGDDAPACRQSIEAMVFLPDPLGFGRLARIRFGGLANSPARAYWDSFSTRMPRRPAMAYVTHMRLVPTDTDNGKFLVPAFERSREIPRAEAQPLIDERDRRIAEWRDLVAGDVVATSAPSNGAESSDATTVYTDGEEPF